MIQVPPGWPSWCGGGRRAWRSDGGSGSLSRWRGWWRRWPRAEEQSCAGGADLNWDPWGWLGSWSCDPESPREICHPLNFHIEICFRERWVGCGRLDLHHRFLCWSRSFKFVSRTADTKITAYACTYKHLDCALLNVANKMYDTFIFQH